MKKLNIIKLNIVKFAIMGSCIFQGTMGGRGLSSKQPQRPSAFRSLQELERYSVGASTKSLQQSLDACCLDLTPDCTWCCAKSTKPKLESISVTVEDYVRGVQMNREAIAKLAKKITDDQKKDTVQSEDRDKDRDKMKRLKDIEAFLKGKFPKYRINSFGKFDKNLDAFCLDLIPDCTWCCAESTKPKSESILVTVEEYVRGVQTNREAMEKLAKKIIDDHKKDTVQSEDINNMKRLKETEEVLKGEFPKFAFYFFVQNGSWLSIAQPSNPNATYSFSMEELKVLRIYKINLF